MVDVEKLRRKLQEPGQPSTIGMVQILEALTELEQLREENAELKDERKDWGKDPDEYRVMSQCQMELMGRVEDYRAGLAALVDACEPLDTAADAYEKRHNLGDMLDEIASIHVRHIVSMRHHALRLLGR